MNENGVAQSLRQEEQPAVARRSPISTILIVLLVILGIFWILIALLQLIAGLTVPGKGYILITAFWNMVISICNLFVIRDILRRYKRVVQTLLIFGCVGAGWGLIQLLSGASLQACVIPIYIALGVLPQLDKSYFSVLTSKEIDTQKKEQEGQSFLPKSSNAFSRWLRKLTVGDVEKDI